ncbi:MAG: hypothetical protein DME19_04825 [Verrucomicrobia bacterium]|nr:MAG: hypothetical protein DME19_04825 [Verrucomicrobiota bacterium]
MERDFPETKIRALNLLNRVKTSSIQHRTPNAEVSEDSRCHSMFGVGCSSGFMESFHGFATAHLDHERWGKIPSSPDLPATGIS